MWETLDDRDQALVRLTQAEWFREAEMRRLAREARSSRRSMFARLAARLSSRSSRGGR
jgi:hypothetical protein